MSLRVTGGVHRSRLLAAPRGHETRPTADRVREALFSILGADEPIEGARALDLYAGTGALGIEALSRGAAHATFVERGRDALAALRANLEALALATPDRSLVVAGPVARALRAFDPRAPRFSLVLCDPPYALVKDGEAERVLGTLATGGLLAEGARVVLEHAAADEPPRLEGAGLSLGLERAYGDSALALYRFVSPSPA